jgi:hypothetical protein
LAGSENYSLLQSGSIDSTETAGLGKKANRPKLRKESP